jgi:isocitrate dehydrogenase (NAD+)
MAYKVTLIPGDGIGPEVIEAARKVLEATGVPLTWDVHEAGAAVMDEEDTPLPESVLDAIRANEVALKGPITTPVGVGFRSVNVEIRRSLDLYANVRPAQALPGIPHCRAGVNLVVVRENTEGLYAGIEHDVIPDEVAEAVRIISRKGSERVVRYAFEYARAHGRRKVTVVHKANILKITDGLFLRTARHIAETYKDIVFEDLIVDNMCLQLVLRPLAYDVLVMPNLYGDIISDLCAGLVGGLGVTPSANIGEDLAVFEPVHGSAPEIAGLNKANPTAAILSGAMLLRHLGESGAASRIEQAIAAVIAEGRNVTFDLKLDLDYASAVSTEEMTKAVIAAL